MAVVTVAAVEVEPLAVLLLSPLLLVLLLELLLLLALALASFFLLPNNPLPESCFTPNDGRNNDDRL